MDLICHTCGKSFKNFPSNIKNNKNTYCSQECHYKNRSINKKPNCEICNKKLDMNRKGFYNNLCKNCYLKDYYKKNPEAYTKRQDCIRNIKRKKKGLPITKELLREKNGAGSSSTGYRVHYRPEHPNSSKDGRIGEHVIVMSEYLGRPMFKGETIHHKNGIRLDNRIENLELWSKKHPPGQRVKDQIKWAIELLEKYGAKVDLSGITISDIFTNNESLISS